MDQERDPVEQPFDFHVDLSNAWERQYLARRLGVSEEALLASSRSSEPTIEELFDSYCPMPGGARSHAQLHLDSFA
jgi:hypothetical protein